MPCYIDRIKPPSKDEFKTWQGLGYIGTWDDYCTSKQGSVGQTIFLCGEFGPHCADCAGVGDILCDYPVGDGKTCDRAICSEHAVEIAPDLHYCKAHHQMWEDFKNSGGVDAILKNVIAFKNDK